jgi:hypothetical protein
MGMAAAATSAVGRTEQLPGLTVLGHLFLWPALAAWALTAACAARRRWRRLRTQR